MSSLGVELEAGVAMVDETAAFEAFFAQASRPLVGQAYVLTGNLAEAQDIVQETFLRAWKAWPTLSTADDPTPWARRVVHNLAVSRWRHLKVRQRHEMADRPRPVAPPDASHLDLIAAVSHLPEGQRKALVLFDLVGLSGAECAEELGVPGGTVRGWLSKARASVAAELGWNEDSADFAGTEGDGR
ncbi:MAG: RNA polymerase sigma factor [Acidimicrobiales bacterium]